MATIPASPASSLPHRPYLVEVTVSSPGSVETLAVPEGARHFEIKGTSGTMRWGTSYTGSGALAKPYDEIAVGSSYGLPDKLNFLADLPENLYFDTGSGSATVLVAFS